MQIHFFISLLGVQFFLSATKGSVQCIQYTKKEETEEVKAWEIPFKIHKNVLQTEIEQ